jgi:very-short-patch-repair endonuclease
MATLWHFFPRKDRPEPPAAVPESDADPEPAPSAPSGGEDPGHAGDSGDDPGDDDIQATRYCCCPKEHCFDRFLQCPECDDHGKPHKARRVLKRNADGTFTDSRDGQHFKPKTTKRGTRLVPQFKGRVDWKSAKGFAAMLLILSCLGAEGEYVLWDETTDTPMSEEEWRKRKLGNHSKVPVYHRVCDKVVTSTLISTLLRGHSIGCNCNATIAKHWRHRRGEVVAMGEERGFEVLTTEEEWLDECDGRNYHPKLKCLNLKCKGEVTSTCIASLQQGGGIGCDCSQNHWRHRRAEVVAMGEERGFEVLTTEEEWVDECDGCRYYPKLKCLKCKDEVTSTCLHSLQSGQGIGCSCRNKTERKLHEWLQNKFAQARVTRQHPGPKLHGQTHFDFLLAFPDGLKVLIELDGAQHFWTDAYHYTEACCERDLAKERWALGEGMSVVRVLQKDVWEDRFGWDQHILRSVGDSRGPRVFTYDAPEYTSTESVYVQLRSRPIGDGLMDLRRLQEGEAE